ncbi:malonic semialdehyde reductase [Commensalibacter papalotli (ex Servin-Garciduenas et al. 2014)]|uniref:Malonic semialdehyde reductase n=1 Tax=Commensalibacter papalotli (ex Servin-Garciduenas et al. 2014) TaxID=1208583 RepID=W7E299_9PROT|nr:malonic semialdehyde reductase [Commensalibacter papalotli (ex Servin-Garciduenas et al. 2014)]EUK19209.1 malonic semialdehyde reductase [Commensalibacter papalotli (ex Servin-Garciduenas et al. 2014)]
MNPLPESAIQQLFEHARTPKAWQNKEVEPALLVQLYNLVKLAPTSGNCQPGRFAFLTHVVSKEKLRSALSTGNVDNALSAPVIAIIAQDPLFYEELPRLYPEAELRSWYAEDIPFAEETASRNSTLQGGYFIMAARALGLDVWPMSGFDNSMVDSLFFEEQGWHSNLLLCLGYAKQDQQDERLPRLEFEDACLML